MQQKPNFFQIRLNGIIGLIGVILFFVLLFFIAKGIFTVLAWAAPVLIIGALLINYRTVLGFLRFLWNTLRSRPVMGILGIIFTVIGFPIVCGYLFGKAILDRRIAKYYKQVKRQREGELIDYEDVTDDKHQKDILVLKKPPIQEKKEPPANTYDEFFEIDDDRD